ncbi:MAG: penicillin acylase family protein [Acidobacteria bacterium]|nr:penicillin acylase family protein [Acidobacteriota bacterium]
MSMPLKSLRLAVCVALCLPAVSACRRSPPPPPLTAQVDGQIALPGISAPVRIVRDRWGVPHIYAQSQEDLFVAQGFVQAQDRLFQMDLWRRSVQGRLSQVFGSNFASRDAMTRRIQYRGDRGLDWASYGGDTRQIAEAFVRGVNAWVAAARQRPPEEFRLAGWAPEFWSASDLLNRTDAFLASGDALEEVARASLSDVIGDAIRRVGTAPFFIGLEAPVAAGQRRPGASVPLAPHADAERVPKEIEAIRRRPSASGRATASAGRLTFAESSPVFSHPSARYFVHLQAPGWNVIGATRPWLPGVAFGHNERIAWAMIPTTEDTQDVYADALEGAGVASATDRLVIYGRREPFEFDTQFTPHGVVVATDRDRGIGYALRWSGVEPGGAAELAALAVDRARDWPGFRAALERWKMPVRHFAYADADGNIGDQVAGLVPVREGRAWTGWKTLDDLPHAFNPPGGGIDLNQEAAGGRADAPATFVHPFGINPAARARFDIGPLPRPAGGDAQVAGSLDVTSWDRAEAMNAAGQSESPSSPHFSDLAAMWSRGERFPLAFSEADVQAHAAATLRLVPARSAGAALGATRQVRPADQAP